MSVAEPATHPVESTGFRRYLGAVWKATGRSPAWPLLTLLVVFFAFQSPFFLSPFNISVILGQTVLVGMLAIGLTPLAISGNIDLSVGAIAALGTCLTVAVQPFVGPVGAVAVTLACSTLCGVINGLIVERLKLNSIIVTIAVGTALHGATYLLFGVTTKVAPDTSFVDFGSLKLLGLSSSVIIFLLLAIATSLMLRFTVHGVHTYAIGGHRQAALDAGVNVERHVLINFAYSGLFAGLCGVLLVASLGAGSPTYAKDYELWAIIAVVLGGTRLAGGAGTVAGTVAAALSLTVLRNGMTLMKIDVRWFLIALGLSLIVALILDRLRSGEPDVAE
ncbi:MAG: ABC transporter permease [Devosia sp.]